MRKWRPFLVFLLIASLSFAAYAHSGKTDGNGGHYDDGDYHYHHGYPSHDHWDMDGDGYLDCPYDFDDKTNHNSGGSSQDSAIINKPKQTKPQDAVDPGDENNTTTDSESRFGKYALYLLPLGIILLAVYWQKIKFYLSKLF